MAGPMAFGDYEVVTKDVLGRKLLVTQKAAHGDRLAGKGKLDYRVDIGGLRQKYGEAERQVDGTGGIASARYGVTKNFTLGGHVAATPSATSVSISPAYRLGKLGVASGFYEANNRDGYLSGAAFERTAKDYTFGVDYAKSKPGVDTFGFNSSMRAPAERLTVRGSFRVGTGNINVMHVTNEDVRAGYAQLDFVGYTVPVSHGVHLMTNFTRGKVAGQRTDTVYLNLIWQFDTRSYASAYSGTSGKDTVDQVGAARAPGASNGFGYELRHSNGSALDPYSQAKVIHHSDYARVEGQVNNTGGQQLRLKTTAAWTADGVFVRRASSDAFVFAETGLPGATLESSTGRRFSADADGKVLLSGVPANSEQRLTLKGEEGSQEELVVTAPRRGIVKVQADAAKVD